MSGFTDAAKHILGTVAPFITQATLGPLAPLANAALGKLFGVKADDPAAISAALQNATPEQLLALHTENDSFKAQMAKIGFDEDKLVMDDRASARDMKVKTNDTTPRNLSYLMLTFTGAVIAAILLGYAKVDGALVGSLVGYLVSENKAIFTFWFGSSNSNKLKDQTINDLANVP